MISKKLTGILKTFSHEETREFKKFLLSPFFNTNKNYVKFYRELKKFYPDYKSALLTSEYIFGRMFTGKQYNKQTMWNLNSGLEKLAEEFLTHSALMKNPHDKFNLILDELRLRILDKHFIKKLHEWERMADINKIDEERLYNLASLEDLKVSYSQLIKGKWGIKQMDSVFEVSQIYTLFFFVTIARLIDSLSSARTFRGFSSHSSIAEDLVRNIDFEKIIEISKKKKYKYAGLIEFYYNVIYCSLNQENEKYYFNARKFFFKNHELFSDQSKKNLAVGLANYCLKKILSGDLIFEYELFKINKFRLDHSIAIYLNGKISKALYNQIVNTASSLKEIRWTEIFVKKYTPLLHEEHRESMRKLARAYIYFNTKKYDEVLDSLNKFKSADVNDKLPVKNLIAKTYYEMKEYELLLYHIDSTKHFLKKCKNIGNIRREANSRFYFNLHSILIAIEKNDINKLRKLKENISKEKNVNNKIWLLEKLSEIK